MASQAQITANRNNSKRSTGPRTERGKKRVRSNAFKHGMYAVTIVPFKTKGDTQRLEQRTRQWVEDVQPRNDIELKLVGVAARLTLALERGDLLESKMFDALESSLVDELGRRLLYIAGAEEDKVGSMPPWSDNPRRIVRELQASAEGCRWMLDRWREIDNLLDCKAIWKLPQLLRFIRLQGKDMIEALYDPALNAIFLAWDVLQPGFAPQQWGYFQLGRPKTDPALIDRLSWYEIAQRPADADAAWALLRGIVQQQLERLKVVLATREAVAATGDPDWVECAAFESGSGYERYRRCQSALHRELMRTLDALRKTRQEEFESPDEGDEPAASADEAVSSQPSPPLELVESLDHGSWSVVADPELACGVPWPVPAMSGGSDEPAPEASRDDAMAVASDQPAVASNQPAVGSGQPAVASDQPAVAGNQSTAASGEVAAGIPEPVTPDPTLENAPNKANFALQQDDILQGFKTEAVDKKGAEQTQSAEPVAGAMGAASDPGPATTECQGQQSLLQPGSLPPPPGAARPAPTMLGALLGARYPLYSVIAGRGPQ